MPAYVEIRTLQNPTMYTQAQIDMACRIARALRGQRFWLMEKGQR